MVRLNGVRPVKQISENYVTMQAQLKRKMSNLFRRSKILINLMPNISYADVYQFGIVLKILLILVYEVAL